MLSQSAGYAAIALGYIAGAGGKPVLVKQIAEAASIPPSYLSKIIHSLARKGLVVTQRGIGGGVTLAKPATEITMYDLCVAMDEPACQSRCFLGTASCSDDRACPSHKFWKVQRERVLDFMKQQTIADIAAFEQRRRNNGKNEPVFAPLSITRDGTKIAE
ncbi:MAG: Rrf2 family transcriptional regulator [Phycisphaerales bacterium]|nr:Rrf2 family transcriptional regulator [Phycisphaerales bacterium]